MMREKTTIVFHCEFSQHRGPQMMKLLRQLDRDLNGFAKYPHLCYPEIYLLEGGYKRFFSEFKEWCEGNYIEMDSPLHKLQRDHSLSLNKQLF